MSQTFVHQFTVSLDGFGTGEGQTRRRRSVMPASACTVDVRHPTGGSHMAA